MEKQTTHIIGPTLYKKLVELGILDTTGIRENNIGDSNYAEHIIQPWSIWKDWNLNPWDADIIKRTLREKNYNSRKMDYEKIKHICDERIRQINVGLE